MNSSIRVAAATWKLRPLQSREEFFEHIDEFLSEASKAHVDLLVLPELFSVELLSLHDEATAEESFPKVLANYYSAIAEWLNERTADLSMTVVFGSHIRPVKDRFRNSGLLFQPGGEITCHDKQRVIPYEREVWNLENGSTRSPMVGDPPMSLHICYEIEFSDFSESAATDGSLVFCVPSYTETERGFNRVRWSCLARAVEYQVFVIHSCVVGSIPELNLEGTGSSAVLAPCDALISSTGVLSETRLNEEGLAIAELNFDLLQKVRDEGEVQNWKDRGLNVRV